MPTNHTERSELEGTLRQGAYPDSGEGDMESKTHERPPRGAGIGIEIPSVHTVPSGITPKISPSKSVPEMRLQEISQAGSVPRMHDTEISPGWKMPEIFQCGCVVEIFPCWGFAKILLEGD